MNKKYSIKEFKKISKRWSNITGHIYNLGYQIAKIQKIGNCMNFLDYTIVINKKDKKFVLTYNQDDNGKESKIKIELPFSYLNMSRKEFMKAITLKTIKSKMNFKQKCMKN